MNASDGLRISAWRFPDKKAAVYFERSLTYEGLDSRVNRLANGLLERGFKKGDKIAYMLYNCIEGLEIIQACLRMGAVLVPINFRLDKERTEFIINHCDATCLFVGSEVLDDVRSMMPNLKNIPQENYILIGEGDSGMVKYESVFSNNAENPAAEVKPQAID